MTVMIKRNTGRIGRASKIAIKLNGKKVEKIKNNQKINLTIQKDRANLRVMGFGCKSNKVEVKDGDIVEVTTTKWGYISYYFYFFFLIFMFFVIEKHSNLLAIISTLLLISFFVTNTYHLKVSSKKV